MNRYHLLSLICFVSGFILLLIGVIYGEIEVGFILIFPFLAGSGLFAFLGFLLFFIAMILFMFGFVNLSTETPGFVKQDFYPDDIEPKKAQVKGGGIILIGPIPIVFGSNWKIAVFLMILAVVLMVIIYLFAKGF